MTPGWPLGGALAGLVVAGALVVGSPQPAHAEVVDCRSAGPTTPRGDDPGPSRPAAQLRIPELHDRLERAGRAPGGGVRVAVVSSGVSPALGAVPRTDIGSGGPPQHYQGTAVAGVVAAYAPQAQLRDVRVYDQTGDEGGGVRLSSNQIAAGLQSLAGQPVDIVVVPVAAPRTRALTRAVDALADRDVIVVAAAGDRPVEGDPLWEKYGQPAGDGEGDDPPSGEDAAKDAWPAGYDDVVAVGTTVPEGTEPGAVMLPNSAVDIAVPTAGAVSYDVNGGRCVLGEPGTDIAAAQVAGIVALLRSAYPRDTPRQLLSRLYATATGPAELPDHHDNLFTGHGVAQPLEALRRPLRPGADGGLPGLTPRSDRSGPVPAPQRQPDVLAEVRGDAVWWGMIGGGALLVALLLSRLRRASRPVRR